MDVLSLVGIKLLEFKAVEMVKEADVLNKGYLTLKEIEMAILAAARQARMLKAIVHHWKQDTENYEMVPPEVEGTFRNIQTETEVNKFAFVNNVDRVKFENSDTRRRKPKYIPHTWTGNPICTDEDLQRVRPKTIRARQLLDSMFTQTHADSCTQRLPLHFCCSSTHPEAAVMVRDLLATYERGSHIKDHNGRMPLHVACMNESYMSVTMVRLLIQKCPSAARIRDLDGNLPLHLCLIHNHGDAALEIVRTLLEVYPKAAAVAYGERYFTGLGGDKNLAIHLALKQTSIHAAEIISCLVNAYPEALMRRSDGGMTLLHRFCWIEHPCPIQVRKALETERGIDKLLRAPVVQQSTWQKSFHGHDTPGLYSAVAKLKAIISLATRYFPHSLNQLDANGALPIHYLCQVGGPCARELLKTLIELHPHSMLVQDGRGNSPLHLTIGCNHPELSEVLAHEASTRHWSSKLTLPNARDQLPSQVAGSWRVRSIFKMSSHLDQLIYILQALLSPTIAGLVFYLIWDYAREQIYWSCSLLAIPFALLSIICLATDLNEAGFTIDMKNIQEILSLTLLQICQMRIPMMYFSLWSQGRPPSRILLRMKSIEMVVVALPLSILNVYWLIDDYAGAGHVFAGARRSTQAALTCLSWLMLVLSAMEHDNYRFWEIPTVPTLRYWEFGGAFLFRAAESHLRILNFAVFVFVFGGGFLCLVLSFEIFVMIVISGKIKEMVTDPIGNKALKILFQETFDLCGTFHPFHKASEVDVVLGQCGLYDAIMKTVVKVAIQLAVFLSTIDQVFLSDQDSKFWPTTYVSVACCVGCGQMMFFAFHYWLMQLRKKHLSILLKMSQLEAWKFPLFDNMPQDMLNSAEGLLVTCSYEPGDHIVRQGELSEVMHLVIKGSVSMQDAYELPRRSSLMRSLSKASFKLGRRMSFKSASNSGLQPGDVMTGGARTDFSGSAKNIFSVRKSMSSGSANHSDDGDTLGSASSPFRLQRSGSNFSVESSRISEGISNLDSLQKEESRVLAFHGICFGADGLFLGSCCSKDIVARTKCQTRALTRESCRQLLRKHPRIKSQFVANLRSLGHKISSEHLDALVEGNSSVLFSRVCSEGMRSVLRGTLGSFSGLGPSEERGSSSTDDIAKAANVEMDSRSVYLSQSCHSPSVAMLSNTSPWNLDYYSDTVAQFCPTLTHVFFVSLLMVSVFHVCTVGDISFHSWWFLIKHKTGIPSQTSSIVLSGSSPT
jgi:CRP-like cAMP-binding protein